MKYLFLFLSAFLFNLNENKFCCAQENFDFYNEETSIYVFGEEHYHKSNFIFYKDAICYLMRAAPENDIVIFLEYPFVLTEPVNNYLAGDSIFLNKVIALVEKKSRYASNDVKSMLNAIKSIKNEGKLKNKVRVVCFNTITFGRDFYDAIEILALFYPELQNYLAKSVLFSERSKKHIQKERFINDLIENVTPLETSRKFPRGYNNKYYDLTDCLKLLKEQYVSYPFFFEQSFYREFIMTYNVLHGLRSIYDLNIIITGSHHAFKQDFVRLKDLLYLGETYKSMAAQVLKDFDDLDSANYQNIDNLMLTFGMTYHSKLKLKQLNKKYTKNVNNTGNYFINKQDGFKDTTTFDEYFDYRVYLRKSQPFKLFHGLKSK